MLFLLLVASSTEMSTDIFDMQIVELGEIYLFLRHEEEDAPYTEGLALVLSISAQKVLSEWESHGPRIIKAFLCF